MEPPRILPAIPGSKMDPVAGWLAIREVVAAAQWTLDETVLAKIEDQFLKFNEENMNLTGLTREFGQAEFLLPLASHGAAAVLPTQDFERAKRLLAAQPAFQQWFRAARLADGSPVLLAGRWLCHLAGIRHATVEIFIDPLEMPGHTLVQVRGMDKFEAPGAFDMPCAGHVSGTDTVEMSLGKELSEELNLTLEDLNGLQKLCCYESRTGDGKGVTNYLGIVNIEYRTLYCATIKPDAYHSIRFSDGEVAGLAVFTVEALQALIRKYPERVASGLLGAMPFYRV